MTRTNWLTSAGKTALQGRDQDDVRKICYRVSLRARPASICPLGIVSMPACTISVA